MRKDKPVQWSSYFDETHEIVGWLGALCILVAYMIGSFGWVQPQSYLYQGLNLLGAIGLLVNAHKNKAYPSFILNGIWILIGIYVVGSLLLTN